MKELTIPKVRERLLAISAGLDHIDMGDAAREIEYLVTQLHRRKAVRRAPAQSLRVTEEMKQQMRFYAERFPEYTQQHIADAFHVTSGRVSEALAGKRGE